ncbi:MAG: hypothetical protein M1814_004130 [Vezdaea aestivalis]|nr:MAG: hypothetical protein M1814_004130 [Vezdaea aestivalis]
MARAPFPNSLPNIRALPTSTILKAPVLRAGEALPPRPLSFPPLIFNSSRRRAYDSHGAGWDGIPDLRNDGTDGCQGGEWKHAGKGWRQRPDSPAYNATWEDWEKWYARRDRAERGESEAKQPYMFRGMGMANGRPIFASNAMAVSVLVLLAALAGVGQATRAKTSAERENDKRDMVHKGCNQFLSQKKHLKAGGKDECVSNFLSNRENTTFGFRDTSNKAETPATGEEQNTRFKSVGSQRG